jgi:phage baseplate assembly protein W
MNKWTGFYTSDKGYTKTIHDIELVKQSLVNAFSTRVGTRVMRPNYGFIGHNMLFENQSSADTSMLYDDAIRIFKDEPRVSVVFCDVKRLEYGYIVQASLQYIETLEVIDFIYEFNTKNNISTDLIE